MILTFQSNFTTDFLSLVSQKYLLNLQNPEGVPGITSRSQDNLILWGGGGYLCALFHVSEVGVRDNLPYILTLGCVLHLFIHKIRELD